MANDVRGGAVAEAAHLDEIGFPEFTVKLITDVFDALVAANLRQTEAYIELLQAVAKTLSVYINETRDDIDGAQVLQFLSRVLPPADGEDVVVKEGAELNVEQAGDLNDALLVKDTNIDADNQVVPVPAPDAKTTVNEALFNSILEAVANRLAANKYGLLKEMVKQGILRLVVEQGKIETRLTFRTYVSTFYQKNSSDYHSKSSRHRAKAKTGGLLSPWVKAAGSTSYNSINIRTTKESNRDISGSQVQIYGSVVIQFKTDYLPLE